MANGSNKQKKEQAKQWFLTTDKTQKEIAELVGVTSKTMSKWCQEWKRLKAAHLGTKESLKARLMNAINLTLEDSEKEGRPPTDKEADNIAKLNKALEALNVGPGLSEYIQVFKDFNEWLLRSDPALAGKFSIEQEKFIGVIANGK